MTMPDDFMAVETRLGMLEQLRQGLEDDYEARDQLRLRVQELEDIIAELRVQFDFEADLDDRAVADGVAQLLARHAVHPACATCAVRQSLVSAVDTEVCACSA